MEWLTQPEAWIALATLTALEIVLGIDNIQPRVVFHSGWIFHIDCGTQ